MSTTDSSRPLAELSDRTVLLSLEEATHTLNSCYPVHVTSPADAHAVLVALFEAAGEPPMPAVVADTSAARRVLAALAREKKSAETVNEILADPPMDDQMGGEDLVLDLVVLAAVIAFLRLHVDFRFKRANGRSEVEFRLEQQPVPEGLLTTLVRAVVSLLQRDSS
ncbi:hypothetical protein [Streptomyces sp. NPDC097610]|uniref:hypothetical protein n=1 Tax=Streptomyces sp. NPDC097610 TaxID=3157227 RepID=UPI00331C6607